MPAARPWRRLAVPAATTAAMLAVLLFLGTWQLERRAWKRDLLAAIAAAERAPPVPLAASPPLFTRVRAEGRFDPDRWALFGAEVRTRQGNPTGGARLLGLLLRDDAAPLLVDRGWVPLPLPPIAFGPATVTGYIRTPERPGTFTPADDPAARRFYTLDPAAIGRALGVPDPAPFVLVALADQPPDTLPAAARTLPRPTDNHLSYAATWYGLAAVLVVIFALYARKVLRP